MIPRIDRDFVKNTIDSVRENIGRYVTFYTAILTACPLCVTDDLYDPVNDVSFNILCPQCKGVYWLEEAVGTEVLARVHWVNDEQITATSGGKYWVGEANLTINIDDLEIAETCQSESGKVVVDNHSMQITRIIPFGAPDINRYRIILKNMGDRPEN